MKKYILNEEELLVLVRAYEELNTLEENGVDNWEWYGEALEDFNEYDDKYFKEICRKEYTVL